MPSPFPGMDPFLEATDFWQGFHNAFMTYLRDAIQAVVPDGYATTLEMRIYLETDAGSSRRAESRVPDLEVVRTGPTAGWLHGVRHEEIDFRGMVVEVEQAETREAYLLIRDLDAGELITSVELLSPSNKRAGDGRDQYRVKQTKMVQAGVNLVEIDLLRGGAHTILPAAERVAELPPFHYVASVYRAQMPGRCELFTWSLPEPLPEIPIPLAPEDQDVRVSLAEVFDLTYDRGLFRRLLKYKGETRPPLAPEDAAWADGLLREAGLRSTAGA